MSQTENVIPRLDILQKRSLMVGIGGSVLCLIGVAISREQFFQSYLLGFLFWIGIVLGSAAVVMLHYLVGGAWGFVIRRICEAAARTLPIMAVLFVPVVLGMHSLYGWTHAEVVAGDPVLQHKAAYLNVPMFLVRAVIYFGIWGGLIFVLHRWSAAQDQGPNPDLLRRMQLLSGPGLILYVFTVTFASMDWAMSLEPHWFSTIYGLIFVVGQVLGTLALTILVLLMLSNNRPLLNVVGPGHFHDLGNLALAFVLLWAYMSFSQFLIIWMGNLAEEVPWYIRRSHAGWQAVSIILIVCHFALPFLLLLSKNLKRQGPKLAKLAVAILVMHWVDLYWQVAPAFHETGPWPHWLDVVVPITIGGFWLHLFARSLKMMPLLPLHDPRQEAGHDD